MGNAFAKVSTFWPHTPSSEPLKLILLGLDAAGKTTILYKLAGNQKVESIIPTIGFNVETLNIHGSIFTAWDVGGRSKLRPLARHYYKGSDGLVFVIDSNDMYQLDQAKDELQRALVDKDLHGIPLLLLCNKQDLPNALPPSEIVERLGLGSIIDRSWHAFPCVATTGEGLHDGLDWLAQLIALRKETDVSDASAPQKETQGHLDKTKGMSPSQSRLIDVLGYDPTRAGGNLTLKHFAPIKNGTECPFSKAAKLWGGAPVHVSDSSLEQQAKANVSPLVEFARRNESERLDGFCVELDDPLGRSASPKDLGECVRRFLTALSDDDPQMENMMKVKYIGQRGWRFRFAGADFFITTFAPCYPSTSSRFDFGTGKAFLLLQPEQSFLRHDLPFDTPVTNTDLTSKTATVRDKTRVGFQNAGRGYHVPSTTRYAPAEHIVKPLIDNGLNIIKWWLDPTSSH